MRLLLLLRLRVEAVRRFRPYMHSVCEGLGNNGTCYSPAEYFVFVRQSPLENVKLGEMLAEGTIAIEIEVPFAAGVSDMNLA